jgi:hypothetical protein
MKNRIKEEHEKKMFGVFKSALRVKLIKPKMPIKPKGHQGLGSLLRYLLEIKMYEEEK